MGEIHTLRRIYPLEMCYPPVLPFPSSCLSFGIEAAAAPPHSLSLLFPLLLQPHTQSSLQKLSRRRMSQREREETNCCFSI